MSDLGDLFVGLGTLIGSLASMGALIWSLTRSRKDADEARQQATQEAVDSILAALEDGDVTTDELRRLHSGDDA